MVHGPADLRERFNQTFGFAGDGGGRDSETGQDRRNDSLGLLDEREQEVNRLQLLVPETPGDALRRRQSLLGLDREFVKASSHLRSFSPLAQLGHLRSASYCDERRVRARRNLSRRSLSGAVPQKPLKMALPCAFTR